LKILFISPRFPYPPIKGDIVRVYNQIKYLSKKHIISLISFIEHKNELDYLCEMEKYCEQVKTVLLPPIRSYLNVIKGVFSNLPLQIFFYKSQKMSQVIASVIKKNNFDIVHITMVRMAPYISQVNKLPIVLDMIDTMAHNKQRRYEKEKIFLKPIVWLEMKRIEKYEKEICQKVDYSVVVSKIDKEIIGNQYKIKVNPNGVDLYYPAISSGDKILDSIIFSGNMGYLPNIDAVRYFTKEIFPLVKKKLPETKFYIVGARPHRDIKRLHNGKDLIYF